MTLQSLRHPNVLQFLGVCPKPPNLCMVTEHLPFTLHSVLYTSKAQVRHLLRMILAAVSMLCVIWRALNLSMLVWVCVSDEMSAMASGSSFKKCLMILGITLTPFSLANLQLDRPKLLAMAQDVARAISYLHSRKPPVVSDAADFLLFFWVVLYS